MEDINFNSIIINDNENNKTDNNYFFKLKEYINNKNIQNKINSIDIIYFLFIFIFFIYIYGIFFNFITTRLIKYNIDDEDDNWGKVID